MSATVNTRIQFKRDTTANWNAAQGFIPLAGEVIIYTDYKTIDVGGVRKNIPGIKIGTGNGYVQDLVFVDEELRETLMNHIENLELHTTLQEKLFWNNKINVDDAEEQVSGELENETLILNRN